MGIGMIYDVIVVGAGPAGCFCAARLAGHGKKVLLLEAEAPKRRKVCGDGLSAACISVLKGAGFPVERLEAHGAAKVGEIVVRGDIPAVSAAEKRHLGLSRAVTDELFRAFAAEKGAILAYRTKIREIGRSGELFSVAGHAGRAVVLACGAHSGIVLPDGSRPLAGTPAAAGISAAVEGETDLPPALYFFPEAGYGGTYAWLFKTEGKRWNFGLWMKGRPRELKKRFEAFEKSRVLPHFSSATIVDPPRGAVMQTVPPALRCEGVYRIGDAEGTADPNSGEGVRQAILSGIGLADSLNL